MMSEKRYTFECNDNNCLIFENDVWLKIEEVVDLLNELYEENEQLKSINNQIDEELIDEEMTNMECLLLLIPFGILFVLLAMIIIAFLVQLGLVVI